MFAEKITNDEVGVCVFVRLCVENQIYVCALISLLIEVVIIYKGLIDFFFLSPLQSRSTGRFDVFFCFCDT